MASRDSSPGERSPLLRRTVSETPAEASDSHDGKLSWEAGLLFRYSVPLVATYLLQYSFTVTTTIVAGHLAADDLAAASLGLSTLNIIGLAIFEGMATALDTLCSQAYGSGRFTGVGLHVQKMLVFMTATMIPVGAFWLCSPWILPLLVPQRDIALKAGTFLQVSLIGLPGYAFFEAGKRFLQAQGDFRSAMVVLVLCTPVNAFLSWYLAIRLDMGLTGAALGQAIANDLRPLLLLIYTVFFGKWSHKCWGGFSSAAFREWGPMVRLSVAGSAVNMAEWLAFEILLIGSSYLSTNHLAAQTVLSTVSIVTWHFPFAVSVAVSTRIGHLIGANRVVAARRATALYGAVFVAIGIFDGLFLFLLRHQLASLISDDPTVQRIAAGSMLSVAIFQVIDAIIAGCNGMLRGLGRQHIAAWVVLIINYLGAVPTSMWLMLGKPGLELDGLWIGIGLGMVLTAVVECLYMKYIRWQDCVEDVRKREDM